MAIRKFKSSMKPIVWVITLLFLGSMIAGYIVSFKGKEENAQIAFKLNGKKVSNTSVQRTMATLAENYSRYLGVAIEPEIMNVVSFNEAIDRTLILEAGEKLKIKVPNSDVTAEMDKIKSAFKSTEEFKQVILSQGYTRKSLENEIKENMLLQKSYEAIISKTEVSQKDIEEYYDEFQYSIFNGRPFEYVKNQIEQELKEQKNIETFMEYLTNARENMVLTDLNSYYENYMVKEEFNYKGVEVTNLTFAKRILDALPMTKGNMEEAKELAKNSIESEIDLIKAIERKGVVIDNKLPLELQVNIGVKSLFALLKTEVKYTDKELTNFFEENKNKYDTTGSVDANLAILSIVPSESDNQDAKNRAKTLLSKITKENFGDMAMQHSTDLSASTGGYLGKFSRGDMVKPFEKAVFEGEIGEIYPEVVETQFGYHIIFIESRDDTEGTATARHILISPEISEKTIKAKTEEVNEIVNDLKTGKITFVDLKNVKDIVFSEKIDGITEEGYIPGVGYNEKLSKNIFDSKIDEVNVVKEDKYFIIYKKEKQIIAKKAVFQEVEKRVINDYKDMKAREELRKIELEIKK